MTPLVPRSARPPLLAGLAVLGLDQASKALAFHYLAPHGANGLPVAGGFVALRYLENSGAAFGLLRGQGIWLMAATVLIVVLLIGSYHRLPQRTPFFRLTFGAVLGGAIGNLVDRVRLGYVVDFIDLRAWPVFNLADSVICAGAIILTLGLLARERQRPRQPVRLEG